MDEDRVEDGGVGRPGRRVLPLLGMVVVIPLVAWLVVGGRPAGTFGQPVPTAPPEGTPLEYDVTTSARLAGPIAARLDLRIADDAYLVRAREGDDHVTGFTMILSTRDDAVVPLPVEDLSTSGAPRWTIDHDAGVGMGIGMPETVELVAAADGPVGDRVLGLEVDPRAASSLYVQVALLDIGSDVTHRTMSAPFGDGQMIVDVELTPVAPSVASGSLPPVDDVAGTELGIPAVGEARTALIGRGHPVWITSTAAHGVTVVDARSPEARSPVSPRWWPGAVGGRVRPPALRVAVDGGRLERDRVGWPHHLHRRDRGWQVPTRWRTGRCPPAAISDRVDRGRSYMARRPDVRIIVV